MFIYRKISLIIEQICLYPHTNNPLLHLYNNGRITSCAVLDNYSGVMS